MSVLRTFLTQQDGHVITTPNPTLILQTRRTRADSEDVYFGGIHGSRYMWANDKHSRLQFLHLENGLCFVPSVVDAMSFSLRGQ